MILIPLIHEHVEKIQHTFMVKILERLGIQGTYPNAIKVLSSKHIANIILNEEKPQRNSAKISNRQDFPLFLYLFNIELQVLDRAIRQLKEIKEIQIGKEEVKV